MNTQITNPHLQITNRPGRMHSARETPLGPNPEPRVPSPELPRFVVTLEAEPGENGLIRVPLAITGKWVRGATTFAITREDLEAIVRNFRERQNGEINVDYDHASEMPLVAAGGPVPSAGRIVRLDPPEREETSPGSGVRSPESSARTAGLGVAGGRSGASAVAGSGSRESGAGSRGKKNSQFQIPVSKIRTPDSRIPNAEPRFILYGWYEPTARARALLESREYRFISPAIEWGAKSKRTGQTQGTTLTSVALTNRPFLEELPPIRLSDPAFQPVEDLTVAPGSVGSRQRKDGHRESAIRRRLFPGSSPATSYAGASHFKGGNMKHVNLSIVDGRIHIAHEDLADEFYFEPEDLAAVGARHGVLLPDGSASAAFSETAVVTYAQARTLLSEAEAQGKFIAAAEVVRAQAEQELDEAVRAGKILPRQRDDWRKIALSDLPTFRKLMSAQKAIVPLAPLGLAGTPPADVQEQIRFLAEQRMRERQISFGQALSEIGREQPDLMQQYRRAVSSRD